MDFASAAGYTSSRLSSSISPLSIMSLLYFPDGLWLCVVYQTSSFPVVWEVPQVPLSNIGIRWFMRDKSIFNAHLSLAWMLISFGPLTMPVYLALFLFFCFWDPVDTFPYSPVEGILSSMFLWRFSDRAMRYQIVHLGNFAVQFYQTCWPHSLVSFQWRGVLGSYKNPNL